MTEVESKLCQWIENTLQGKVTSCASQERWRDAWFVTVERGSEILPLYVRGDRYQEYPFESIEYEAGLLDVLHEAGVPTPKIYGICPDPRAIVMERSPGRHNLATAEDEAERVSVLEHLGELMARMHLLDVSLFTPIGARLPKSAEEIAIPYLGEHEDLIRRHADAPDPRCEFMLRWLRNNIPEPPGRLSLVQVDAGQFMFDKGRVTALLDFELACISDPMMDIAALRIRSLAEPMGDIRPLLRRYVAETGFRLDRRRIAYYVVAWMWRSAAWMPPALYHPKQDLNFAEYLSWYLGSLFEAYQAIAEHDGFTLDTSDPPPIASPGRWASSMQCVVARFSAEHGSVEGYERTLGANNAAFADRIATYGEWAESEFVADVARMTGTIPTSWRNADKLLSDFVKQAGPEFNEPLVQAFYRWGARQFRLIERLYTFPFGRMVPIDELLDL